MAIPFRPSGPPRPFGGGGGGQRRPYPTSHTPQLRKNDRIRAPEVRVIGHDGKQIGILPTREALRIAMTQGFDLVEVSPGTRPPVCKILDYGKYMYEEGKKQKGHKPHASKLKEVKFRPRIEQHDYITKLRHIEEFLFHGDKVKLTLFFKGREMEHKEFGFETMKRALVDLSHVGTADQPPRLFGRNITTTISPLPPNKRKWKYSLREGQEPERPDHDRDHSDGADDDDDDDGHEAHPAPNQPKPAAPTGAVVNPTPVVKAPTTGAPPPSV